MVKNPKSLSILLAIVSSSAAVIVSALVAYDIRPATRHHHPPNSWSSPSVLASSSSSSSSSSASSAMITTDSSRDDDDGSTTVVADGGASVAFLGNSIQYYNDCPRFLHNLSGGSISRQDSCLRGGATLTSLWERGNGMGRKFATKNAEMRTTTTGGEGEGVAAAVVYDVGEPTVQALLSACYDDDDDDDDDDDGNEDGEGRGQQRCVEKGGRGGRGRRGGGWDFVVLNDHTQGPARDESRRQSLEVLLEKYLPLIYENKSTPIIIETAAYRYPGINRSEDLGKTPREFQERVRVGVLSYVEALRSSDLTSIVVPRMAPVGTAYLRVHDDDPVAWGALFDPIDHFHPSPSGTFLQGCVLHWTMFGFPPPHLPRTEGDIRDLWRDARVMHDARDGGIGPIPLPSPTMAEYLWNVAGEVCSPPASSSSL